MDDEIKHVQGKNAGRIMLYALSTCGWCAKTKKLLDDLGIEYDFVYVDQLQGEGKEQAIKEIKKWNPSLTFPTIVINDENHMIGYKEEEILKALRL